MNAKVIVFLALVALAVAAEEEGKQQKRDLFGLGYPAGALGYPYGAYNPYAGYNPYGLAYNPYTGIPSRLATPWAPAVAPIAPWGAALAAPAIANPLIATARPAAYGAYLG